MRSMSGKEEWRCGARQWGHSRPVRASCQMISSWISKIALRKTTPTGVVFEKFFVWGRLQFVRGSSETRPFKHLLSQPTLMLSFSDRQDFSVPVPWSPMPRIWRISRKHTWSVNGYPSNAKQQFSKCYKEMLGSFPRSYAYHYLEYVNNSVIIIIIVDLVYLHIK